MADLGNYWEKLPKHRAESEMKDKRPLNEAEAKMEADRCLYCYDAPCIKACPTEIDIPGFIKKIASGNYRGSAKKILSQNMLGYSCSRVCPVEVLCAGDCVYTDWQQKPIEIGKLQRFALEEALKIESDLEVPLFPKKDSIGKKVALVGAGPASLACAAHLAIEGVEPVIFEAGELPGGLNTTGVAPYKLKSEDSLTEVDWILNQGVKLKTNTKVGSDISGTDLLRDFDAVFLGVGLGPDSFLKLNGEKLKGVYGAIDIIQKIKNDENQSFLNSIKRVLIIGGGNTAIDIAHELALLGNFEVDMVYRKTEKQMSGYLHEMDWAKKDGVRMLENLQPHEILEKDGRVAALRAKNTLNSDEIHTIPCDTIVYAIGQSKLKDIASEFEGVKVNDWGCVEANPETQVTGNSKVFAGGDCINGGKEVVNAAADGRRAAAEMLKLFNGEEN